MIKTPRYSIRSLLVLTTVVALFFGWTAYKARNRQQAIALLETNHVEILYGKGFAGGWWSRVLFDDDLFRTVSFVTLTHCEPTSIEVVISELQNLPEIEAINLDGPVPDRCLNQIAQLEHLETLYVMNNKIVTNEGFAYLKQLQSLRTLLLGGLTIDDGAVVHIAAIPNLSRLVIGRTSVSAEGIDYLRPYVHTIESK